MHLGHGLCQTRQVKHSILARLRSQPSFRLDPAPSDDSLPPPPPEDSEHSRIWCPSIQCRKHSSPAWVQRANLQLQPWAQSLQFCL